MIRFNLTFSLWLFLGQICFPAKTQQEQRKDIHHLVTFIVSGGVDLKFSLQDLNRLLDGGSFPR